MRDQHQQSMANSRWCNFEKARKRKHVVRQDNLDIERLHNTETISVRPLFSRDGRTLFVACCNVIKVYVVETGLLLHTFEGHSSRVVGIQIHPENSTELLSFSETGNLCIWDIERRTCTNRVNLNLMFRTGMFTGFVFTPEGTYATSYNGLGKREDLSYYPKGSTNGFIRDVELTRMPHNFDYSFGLQFWAAIDGARLCIQFDGQKDVYRHKVTRHQTLTCVSCHQTEMLIATGVSSGRVYVWHEFDRHKHAVKSEYHWHTMPVRDILFSVEGSFVYSGGAECVLVKWNIAEYSKNFLPRIGLPIWHLSTSSDNVYIAVCCKDNVIHLVSRQKVVRSITDNKFQVPVEVPIRDEILSSQEGSDRISSSMEGRKTVQNVFPAGVVVDPQTKNVIMNGKPGHLQFYSMQCEKFLYDLDITGRNYLTEERTNVIANTDVIRVAISSDGMWLGTVEKHDNGEFNLELRLKFWMFNQSKRNFELNTNFELPHDVDVFSLQFQPLVESNDQLLAASCGGDNKFRIWSLVEEIGGSDESNKLYWRMESVGFYKGMMPGDLSFSSDGSLLAVSFESVVTVWAPESNQLKCSLSNRKFSEKIRRVEFGHGYMCSQLIVCITKNTIGVWNLLNLMLTFTVSIETTAFACGPFSEYMAAFSKNNKLYVFKPSDPNPVYVKKEVSTSPVILAIFVPEVTEAKEDWQRNAVLYYMNTEQKVLTVRESVKASAKRQIDYRNSNLPKTAFAAFMAKQISSVDSAPQHSVHQQLGIPGKDHIKKLLSAPAHTMAPLSLLCTPFLKSLLIQRNKSEENEMAIDDDTDVVKVADKKKPKEETPLANVKRTELKVTPEMESHLESVMARGQKVVNDLF